MTLPDCFPELLQQFTMPPVQNYIILTDSLMFEQCFFFIYLMISKAKKNAKVFLLLFVFSLICALLRKMNLALPFRNLHPVLIRYGFQRFGVISYELIQRE